jgi:NADH-quinone oxidoreductase subunit G
LPGEQAQIASFIASVPAGTEPEDDNFVQQAAAALQNAKKPLILCSVLHEDAGLVEAAFELTRKSSTSGRVCKLAYFYPAANSVGAGLVKSDENPDSILADIESGRIQALVVAEADIARWAASPDTFAKALSACELLVVIDSFENSTTAAANAVIPCVSHYQSFGTFVNFEGRGQRFDGMQFAQPVILAASEILVSLIRAAELEETIGGTDFHDVFDVTRDTSKLLDALQVHDAGGIVRSSPKLPVELAKPARLPEGALHRWDVVHTYGSEELSALSPPVAELAPAPYIEMHPEDAQARGFNEGAELEQFGFRAPLRLNAQLAKGVVAIPRLLTSAAAPAEVVTA